MAKLPKFIFNDQFMFRAVYGTLDDDEFFINTKYCDENSDREIIFNTELTKYGDVRTIIDKTKDMTFTIEMLTDASEVMKAINAFYKECFRYLNFEGTIKDGDTIRYVTSHIADSRTKHH